jgi:cytochrome c biogenesis protein CcmG/thiol:disulfide interchange protein DsbE
MDMGQGWRKLLLAAAGLALLGVVAVLVVSGGDDPASGIASIEDARGELAGAPPPLAGLHEQSNQLLDGGADAFERRLAELRGYPVVVNKWASWCGPCRAEFPYFQRQVLRHGRRVAFIGVNSTDNDGQAERFLERYPVPYPSYKDPEQKVAAVFNGVAAFPTTAFYDSKGKLQYIKQGGYLSESKLAEDIERYAR